MLMDFVAWYCRGFTYMNVDVCIDAIWYGIAISSLRYCTFWQILGKCNNIPSILPRLPNCNTFLKGYYYIISVLLKIKKECINRISKSCQSIKVVILFTKVNIQAIWMYHWWLVDGMSKHVICRTHLLFEIKNQMLSIRFLAANYNVYPTSNCS